MDYPSVDRLLSGKMLVLAAVALNGALLLILSLRIWAPLGWLPHIVPGQFTVGARATGLWLFLALALLANNLGILLLGFAVVFPALLDGVGVDERRVGRLLRESADISQRALDACLDALHREAAVARRRIAIGRSIILASAVALVFTFAFVCDALIHAPPRKPLFVSQSHMVANTTVTDTDIWRFTADQIAGALALDIPELYDFHFGDLDNNIHSRIFTDFVFGFRAILGWVALTSIIVTIRDRRSRPDK